MNYHRLLERQIKKFLPPEFKDNESLLPFLDTINAFYVDYERDKEINAHAFQTSEEEFFEVTKHLENLIRQKNESLNGIKKALKTINPEVDLSEETNLVEVSDLLNNEINKNKALEALNQKILTSALNAIMYFDDQGNISFWNREAERIFGYSREEALKMNFLSILSDACQIRFKKGFQSFLEEGNNDMFNQIRDSVGVTKEGKEIFLELFTIPIETENQYMFCAFIQDKTESTLAHRQLKQQEERYRNLINNINLGLIEVDNEEKVIFLNQSFTNISGFTLEDLKGKPLSDHLMLSKESRDLIEKKKNLRTSGKSDQYEIMVKNKKGEVRWWNISGSPTLDDRGNITGSVGIHLDVTERKKLEFNLIKAKEQAEQNLNMKESILATMSHEIRTPLNGILGTLREAHRLNKNDEIRKQLDYSIIASDHLMSIVNNILDYSKLEAGQMQVNYKPNKLENSFNKVLKILEPKFNEKNLNVTFQNEIEENYFFDHVKLEQILFNIIGNAIKFTDQGKIQIHCTSKAINKNRHQIHFQISDSGIGMDQQMIDQLFTKYSQGVVDESQTKQKGTGLGMAITKELTDLMGGKIEVESTPRKGSTFKFEFEMEVYHGSIQSDQVLNEEATRFQGLRILVVDDNEMNRLVAENALKYTNCELDFAVDAKSTFDCIHQNEYDIILLDLFLPDKNGNEITEILRKEKGLETPIIGMSANINQNYVDKCINAGMNQYLLKPYTEKELIEAINAHVSLEKKSPYDLSGLETMSQGNQEFVHKMIEIFIRNTQDNIKNIKEAILQEDTQAIHQILHRMKPSVNTLKVEKAIPIINDLENRFVKSESLSSADKGTLSHLILCLEEVEKALVKEL